jgi:hypothetical protein
MYAPHEHAQHLCHRVLSLACPGFLAVADLKGDVGATRVYQFHMTIGIMASYGQRPRDQPISP